MKFLFFLLLLTSCCGDVLKYGTKVQITCGVHEGRIGKIIEKYKSIYPITYYVELDNQVILGSCLKVIQ